MGFQSAVYEKDRPVLIPTKTERISSALQRWVKASAHESESLHLAKVGLLVNLKFLTPLQAYCNLAMSL
jgi:hypothetical protein